MGPVRVRRISRSGGRGSGDVGGRAAHGGVELAPAITERHKRRIIWDVEHLVQVNGPRVSTLHPSLSMYSAARWACAVTRAEHC